MKREVFCVLAVILFTSFSLNAVTVMPNRCNDWATAQADAEEDHYGPMTDSEWSAAVGFYYGVCIDSILSDSELLDPYFN